MNTRLSYFLLCILWLPAVKICYCQSDGFGCYETPGGSSDVITVLNGTKYDYSRSFSNLFDNFQLDSVVKDGYYKGSYKNIPWYPKNLKMEGIVRNGKQEGTWTLFPEDNPYWNKDSFYKGNYVNGMKEGQWFEYLVINNEPRYEVPVKNSWKIGDTIIGWQGTFLHDKLNDTVKQWYEYDSILMGLEVYLKGKLNGKTIVYFYYSNVDPGKISSICNYNNGEKNGKEVQYFSNGKICRIRYYKDGKEEGEAREYGYYREKTPNDYSQLYPDIYNSDNSYLDTHDSLIYKLMSIKNYSEGKLSGHCMTISKNVCGGWDSTSENYVNSKKNGECAYYHNGLEDSIFNYSYGILSGEYSKYYKNGQKAFELIFKNGLPYTIVSAYTDSGKVLDAGNLKAGNGILKCYYADGQLKSFNTFENQLLNGKFEYYGDSGHLVTKGEVYSVADTSISKRNCQIKDNEFYAYLARLSKLIKGTNIVEYYDDGNLKFHYFIIDDNTSPYNHCMHYSYYYENGKLQEEYYRKGHNTYGTDISFSDTGQITSYENYKILAVGDTNISVRDGLCKYYYDDGTIEAEVDFANGKEIGHSKYYDDAGKLVREHYVLPEGSGYNVFMGDTVNRINKNGLKEGKWICINDEGLYDTCTSLPNTIKCYKDGEPTGTWVYRDNNNQVTQKLVWEDSVKTCEYDYINDKLSAEGYALKSPYLDYYTRIGKWKLYNTDSKEPYLQWEGEYTAGEKTGIWKEYKKDGALDQQGTYIFLGEGERFEPIK